MYIPEHFQETEKSELCDLIRVSPFACVVAQGPTSLIANHVPLFLAPSDELIGHVALANDFHRVISSDQEVLAVFQTNSAYVSPDYYPSKAQHHRHVPTWNYQVVHVHGQISFQHDEHSKRAAVALLTRNLERRLNGKKPWRMADAPSDYIDEMLKRIVGFRIKVSKMIGKSKLSQNKEREDLLGAISCLEAVGEGELASQMKRRSKPS